MQAPGDGIDPRPESGSNDDGRFDGLKSSTIMMVDDEPTTIER